MGHPYEPTHGPLLPVFTIGGLLLFDIEEEEEALEDSTFGLMPAPMPMPIVVPPPLADAAIPRLMPTSLDEDRFAIVDVCESIEVSNGHSLPVNRCNL